MRKSYQAHSRQDWQVIMDQYASSGLSQKTFCQREGLASSTFSKWRKQLGLVHTKPLAVAQDLAFQPIPNISMSATSLQGDRATCPAEDWSVELAFDNGMTLRIRALG